MNTVVNDPIEPLVLTTQEGEVAGFIGARTVLRDLRTLASEESLRESRESTLVTFARSLKEGGQKDESRS